ncbi:MAG: hypothetical protein KDB14_06855, partial [Planctomycetales bacterium]|nr:hypothetical protein [Planctomycetales bacterium]
MLRVALVAMLSFLTLPAAAQTPTTAAPRADQSAQELPSGAQRFSGMIVGRLAAKDVEKGTFILNVDAVPRVWKNSKAENPKSMVGKRLAVEGVFGKWLDALLLVKEGETLECEARHDGGANLAFLGETLRKVAPFKPGDYPELPEAFRGFNGKLQAKVVKKSSEMLEVIVEVKQVLKVGEGSSAKQPESIVGKQVMLGGFWQRKDAYHQLKVGDLLDLQVQHIGRQSDHLTVREFGRTSATESTSDAT